MAFPADDTRKDSIFGPGLSGAQSAQQNTTQVKKTTAQTPDARKSDFEKARLSKESAEFLARQRARRTSDEKARQKIKIENELHDLEQRWFMAGQKINQLKTDNRRNQMEAMHTAGLARRYKTDVDRYQSEIVKEESIINEAKRQQRRMMSDKVAVAELQKKIQTCERNITKIRNLMHGIEVKIKMQAESADARDKRQEGLERDIDMFTKQYNEMSDRKHALEQQRRYVNM